MAAAIPVCCSLGIAHLLSRLAACVLLGIVTPVGESGHHHNVLLVGKSTMLWSAFLRRINTVKDFG